VKSRFKDRGQFEELHSWLQGVVQHNQDTGVDFSGAMVEAADATRKARIEGSAAGLEARAEEASAERLKGREAQMFSRLGTDRPDVVAAAARMRWTMGGKRELKKLPEHLLDGETVRFLAQGSYENDQGIVALTDRRLLFLFHGMMREAKEDFPLRLISSVQTKSGFATGELRIFVSGNTAKISSIVKGDLQPLADAVREGLSAQSAPPAPAAAPAASDPFEALQKLASLRESGVLTPEEFEAKKKELLERM